MKYYLTPVNGKKAWTLFSTRLTGTQFSPRLTGINTLRQIAFLQKNKKTICKVLIPLFLFIFSIHSSFAGPLPDVPHIVVTGECEIRATPDILTLSLSVAETGFQVAEARDSVEKRSKKLIASLEAAWNSKRGHQFRPITDHPPL